MVSGPHATELSVKEKPLKTAEEAVQSPFPLEGQWHDRCQVISDAQESSEGVHLLTAPLNTLHKW